MKKRPRKRRVIIRKRETTDGSSVESKLEEAFYEYWIANHEPRPLPQHRFHPVKQWRFDFAFPAHFVAIEIQGFGTGHTSYKGMEGDYFKHNEAVRLGWTIVYLMSSGLSTARLRATCLYVQSVLESRSPKYLEAVREINGRRTNIQSSNTWNDKLDRVRRKFFEGGD